jgi:cell division protein FtsZ
MDSELTEYELAVRARAGDREALEKLLAMTRLGLFSLAYAELRHFDDAQDAVAAALLQICLHVYELRQPERFRAWMQSIVRNETRRLRRDRSHSLLRLEDLPEPVECPEPCLLLWDIERALERLPAGQAEAVRLFYLHRLPLKEIARRLGRSPGTVGSWLHRGRRHLAKEISPWIGGTPMTSSTLTSARSRPLSSIKAIGVGGAGGRAVSRMIEAGLTGVQFITVDTDAQALERSLAPERLFLGGDVVQSSSRAGDPDSSRRAAEASREALTQLVSGAELVFILAGLGGGTGTGAAPVLAEIARDAKTLTIGVVTTPSRSEDLERRLIAETGISQLNSRVDVLITLTEEGLADGTADHASPDQFERATEGFRQSVQTIVDVLTLPGAKNIDITDLKMLLTQAGSAYLAAGQASADNRATRAAETATAGLRRQAGSALARSVLFTIRAGPELSLEEVHLVADVVTRDVAAPDAHFIAATLIHENMRQDMRVTLLGSRFVG